MKAWIVTNECPLYNFDDYGENCVPELCDEYEETEEQIREVTRNG